MKAILEYPVIGIESHVDILEFINDGYAVIKKQDGWLDMRLVDSLRVLDGEQDDRQS